jgi:hypothetical protein
MQNFAECIGRSVTRLVFVETFYLTSPPQYFCFNVSVV